MNNPANIRRLQLENHHRKCFQGMKDSAHGWDTVGVNLIFSLFEPDVVLCCHLARCPKSLFLHQGAERDLQGAMNEDSQKQPLQKFLLTDISTTKGYAHPFIGCSS